MDNPTKLARSSFFNNTCKRHLGGPHSRAMTSLFAIPIDHNRLQVRSRVQNFGSEDLRFFSSFRAWLRRPWKSRVRLARFGLGKKNRKREFKSLLLRSSD
jgi:hypothetical protein